MMIPGKTISRKEVVQDKKEKDYSTLSPAESLTDLKSTPTGLTEAEAGRRKKIFGPNSLAETARKPAYKIFLKQFKSLLILVLVFAAVLSYITGNIVDVYVILVVVLVDALIGFIQEWKAEQAVASLKKMLTPVAKVIRNGSLRNINSADIVPGDILVVEEGDSIAADARIIDGKNIRALEASLTGESLPVSKTKEKIPVSNSLGDKKNILFKGTFLAGGHAKAVVYSTGMKTAFGQIATTLKSIGNVKSHFQQKIDKLATQMGIASVICAALLFGISYFTLRLPFEELLLVSVAAMVSIIPEGLPSIIVIVLAIGARRMTKRNAIVREFTATETLGAVTTIITDKTGTITENALTVRKIFIPGQHDIEVSGEGWAPLGDFKQADGIIEPSSNSKLWRLLSVAVYCNNANVRHNSKTDTYDLAGDPTEGALHVLGKKAGFDPLKHNIKRIDDFPFDSSVKLRATLVADGTKKFLLVVGAPEKILKLSSHINDTTENQDLDEATRNNILAKISEWSASSMRIIGLAFKEYHGDEIEADHINNLVLAGLTGMIDPPRAEVREAVKKCQQAGIRVIMATGDHISTAVAIATAVGIIEKKHDKDVAALTEEQLKNLDEKEFDDAIKKVNVFARLNPDTKFRIASRLQEMGELIAMTGDGVNDAPALKKADVGIAMGIMGTDVARDSSKVVLADDNFSTIVSAIEEGRIVFTNARQASFYLITTNLAEITTLIIAIVFLLPMPLTAIQILWLNLVTDGIGDMSLAAERGHGEALRQKPLHKDERILSREIVPFLLINVFLMVGISMGAYLYFMPHGIGMARTAVFIVMSFTQLFNLYNMRSLTKSIFEIGFLSNIYVTITMVSSSMITFAITEIEFFKEIFGFVPLPFYQFLILVALSSSVLWMVEIFKIYRQRSLR